MLEGLRNFINGWGNLIMAAMVTGFYGVGVSTVIFLVLSAISFYFSFKVAPIFEKTD